MCTAYLMKKEKLSFKEAYDVICESYPKAAISDSFRAELERFGSEFMWDMGLDTQAHRLYWEKRNTIMTGDIGATVKYDCRMCRHTLFHDSHIVKDACHSTCSIFSVERMAWMEDSTSDSTGKVLCHQCKTKIGHYSWSGLKCPCGRWHSPAFFIAKLRVDHRPLNQPS